MSFWTYERVLHAQNAWLKAQRDLPRDKDVETKQPVPEIRKDGFGPQIR